MSAHGLYKAAGGFRKREREALERVPHSCCKACGDQAVAVIENALGQLLYACERHARQGADLGYRVLRAAQEPQ